MLGENLYVVAFSEKGKATELHGVYEDVDEAMGVRNALYAKDEPEDFATNGIINSPYYVEMVPFFKSKQ